MEPKPRGRIGLDKIHWKLTETRLGLNKNDMASAEQTPVPRQTFKLLKDKMWRHIRILRAHFTAFEADGTVVEREDIQMTLTQAFEKCQELLNQLEAEMTKQVEYEVAVQRLNKKYVDELLKDMTEDHHKGGRHGEPAVACLGRPWVHRR